MQTVQFAITDGVYATALREALTRTGPWHIVFVEMPDPRQRSVLVLDEEALNRLSLPLLNPERVVLISRKDAQHLSRAWDAGIVSVVSEDDPPNTVLLAIMAAALRVPKSQTTIALRGISPTAPAIPASISPDSPPPAEKRSKTQ